jgi:16S rRNA (uracil1498-N3)-methyltransferase
MKLPGILALPGNPRIVLAESEQQVMLKEVLRDHPTRDLVLAFGPEGGWIQSELELFRNAEWILASLGNTIPRVETAAIAALAVTLSELA